MMTKQEMGHLREIVIAAVVGALKTLPAGVTEAQKREVLEDVFPGLPHDVLIQAEIELAEAAEQPFWDAMAERFGFDPVKHRSDQFTASLMGRSINLDKRGSHVDDDIPF